MREFKDFWILMGGDALIDLDDPDAKAFFAEGERLIQRASPGHESPIGPDVSPEWLESHL